VQIYTGFIYGGPAVVRRVNRGLLGLLQRHGLRSIREAVGRSL
jgi:dihydroorotate dehydrogenase